MKKYIYLAFLGAALWLGLSLASLADLGKVTVSSGGGDQIVIEHGLTHRKTTMEDRLGDKYESEQSMLGNKDTQVNILGNRVVVHKDKLGFCEASGQTILGDSFQFYKQPWAKQTNINLSGVNALLNQYFHLKQPTYTPNLAPNSVGLPLPKPGGETVAPGGSSSPALEQQQAAPGGSP